MKKAVVAKGVAALALAVGVAAGGFYGWLPAAVALNSLRYTLKQEDFSGSLGTDRIHFLNTGSSDAILLESAGHFALIDAAEDTEYPADKPDLKARGYEKEVAEYLKKVAGDAQGRVTLDFVLGTHAHSDHIGGFDTLAMDGDITIGKAYLKEYRTENIRQYEQDEWDNQEVYDQMVEALKKRNVPIISDIPGEPFSFGNFTLQFFNTDYDTEHAEIGENDNSVGVLVTKGALRAFLAGDMDNKTGDEDRFGPEIGQVDLLKVGHHGYEGSTSKAFARALHPKIAILTNNLHYSNGQVRKNLTAVRASIQATKQKNGIIATFTDDERIVLTKGACNGIVNDQ